MLAVTVTPKWLETVARRDTQIVQDARLIEKSQLSQRDRLNIRWQFPASQAGPDTLCFSVGEIADHYFLYRMTLYGVNLPGVG